MEKEKGGTLVTGATGFIGRRLTAVLVAEGYAVRCLVRRRDEALPAGAGQVVGDLLERGTLDAAFAGVAPLTI